MKNLSTSNKKGVTLIELIVVLAILGIVLSAIFSVQLFGTKTFNIGTNQSDIQNDLRLTAQKITDEIRYAENAHIYAAVPAFESQYKYIYYDAVDKSIKFKIGNGTPSIIGGNAGNKNLSFKKIGNKLVQFSVTATKQTQNFNIQSDINLVNLGTGSISGDTTGVAVKYGPISDLEAVIQDFNELSFAITEVTGDFVLPTTGGANSSITWSIPFSSSYLSVTGGTAIVNRPGLGLSNASVTLRATITRGSETRTKDFTIIVKAHTLNDVTINVANGLILNTTTDMYYKVGAGSWVQAGSPNTTVVFSPGLVQISNAGQVIVRDLATIPSQGSAPSVTISDKNSNSAVFYKPGNVRVKTEDNYEYKLNSGVWTKILDNTTVACNGNNTVIVRVAGTDTTLPSLETVNLDQ
jgi:prepilin-type N-terminal cleavage/methylation domain-containing protein